MYDEVYITDLSFTKKQLEFLFYIAKRNPDVKFYFIDHHVNSALYVEIEDRPENLSIYVDLDMSATILTWIRLFYDHSSDNKALLDYVKKVNAYDIWDKDSEYFEAGYDLNDLFWSYGRRRFMFEFKENQTLTKRQLEDIKNIKQEKASYFGVLESKGLISTKDDIVLSFSDKYIADLQVRYEGNFFVNATTYGKIQMRISDNIKEEDCIKIQNLIEQSFIDDENELIGIGGHHRAFGLEHKGAYDHDKIIQAMKLVVGAIIEFKGEKE
jgi:hypothetical protein